MANRCGRLGNRWLLGDATHEGSDAFHDPGGIAEDGAVARVGDDVEPEGYASQSGCGGDGVGVMHEAGGVGFAVEEVKRGDADHARDVDGGVVGVTQKPGEVGHVAIAEGCGGGGVGAADDDAGEFVAGGAGECGDAAEAVAEDDDAVGVDIWPGAKGGERGEGIVGGGDAAGLGGAGAAEAAVGDEHERGPGTLGHGCEGWPDGIDLCAGAVAKEDGG